MEKISRKFKDYSDTLPTEYPFKQMLAIYAGRIAILFTGAFLTALLAVFILLVAKAPTYSFLIAILVFLLIGIHELIKSSRSQDTSSPYRIVDKMNSNRIVRVEYEYAHSGQIADEKSEDRKRMLDEFAQVRAEKLKAEIKILEHSLMRVSKTIDIKKDTLAREYFEIEKQVRTARMSFYAAGACILCEALLGGWLSIQLGFHFLYGIIPAALLVIIFQGLINFLSGQSGSRIIRFILMPSALLFCLSFILILASRVTSGDAAFNPSLMFNTSLWIITTVLPIMAGAFLVMAQELSWYKKVEEEIESLQKEKYMLMAMRERLLSELNSTQISLQAEIEN